jgi:hypothetical protein
LNPRAVEQYHGILDEERLILLRNLATTHTMVCHTRSRDWNWWIQGIWWSHYESCIRMDSEGHRRLLRRIGGTIVRVVGRDYEARQVVGRCFHHTSALFLLSPPQHSPQGIAS